MESTRSDLDETNCFTTTLITTERSFPEIQIDLSGVLCCAVVFDRQPDVKCYGQLI